MDVMCGAFTESAEPCFAGGGGSKKVELEVTRGGKTNEGEATEIKEQPVDYLNARVAPRAARPTTNAAGPATNSANAR